MLDDDKVTARRDTVPITRLPALPLSAEAIQRIARNGLNAPARLSLTDIHHLCNAIVAGAKDSITEA